MRRDRIVAQNRMVLLEHVVNAEHGQAAEDDDRDDNERMTFGS